jgi:hypothetical protein
MIAAAMPARLRPLRSKWSRLWYSRQRDVGARPESPAEHRSSGMREYARGGAVVLKGLRAKLWKRKREQREGRREPAVVERSSGEDAIETAEDEAAEGAPSGMPRLKTDEL